MTTPKDKSLIHSADVRIHLYVNGQILPISHLGGDHFILRTPIEIGPTNAESAMSIDGKERRWNVRLADGIQPGQIRTYLTAISDQTPLKKVG
jgi:hypothetical protein